MMKSHQRNGLHSNGSCNTSKSNSINSNKSHRNKNHYASQVRNGHTDNINNCNSSKRAQIRALLGSGRISIILIFFALLAFQFFQTWRLLMASSPSRASFLEGRQQYINNLFNSNHHYDGGGDLDALDVTSHSLEASYPHRYCESPEYETPFPYRHVETFFSSFAAFQPNANSNTGLVGKSKSSDMTCEIGQQNELTRFLLHASKEIQILRGDQCKHFIRYSASFGSYRKSRKFITKMQFPTIADCTFLFIVDDETRNLRPLVGPEGITRSNNVLFESTGDPTAIRVPIPRHILPFTNMRRNVKLIKMHGPILFPWVERLLWMDAKLNRAGPASYFVNYFQRTVEEPNVCASFVAAPIHPSLLGSNVPLNATMPSFQAHCDTIVSTVTERPDLTDSAEIILRQCEHYARQQEAQSHYPKTSSNIMNNTESERYSVLRSGRKAEPMLLPRLPLPRSGAEVAAASALRTWHHGRGMSSAAAASPLPFATDDRIIKTDLTLDAAMIDSALIAWDLRSDRCRQFNADLGCTWGDEIHCYADRDQLSFPYTLQQMGLTWDQKYIHHWRSGQDRMTTTTSIMERQSQTAQQQLLQEHGNTPDQRPVAITDTKHQHTRLFEHESGLPVVLMVKSECHWYDKPIIDCVLQEEFEIESATGSTISHAGGVEWPDRSNHKGDHYDDDGSHQHHEARRGGHESQPQHHSGKRVAIVMAGPLQRFMIETTLQHLLLPLVQQQGHQVDVYISLTTDEMTRHETPSLSEWIGKLAYLANLATEPFLEHVIDEEFRFDLDDLRSVLQLSVEHQGATLKHLYITDGIDLDSDPLIVARHKEALNQYPDEHPDRRFPVLNLRSRDMKTHNRSRLRFYKSVQLLWENVVDVEERDGFSYDQIVFLPVDSYWFADFHLDRLLGSEEADLFVQSCAVGQLPLMEAEIESYPVVASRESAELLGNSYNYLFEMNLNGCAQILSEKKGTNITTTGCTTGMIFEWARKSTGFTVAAAGRGLFPMERALNVRSIGRETCLLTFCPRSERRDSTLALHTMPQCKQMAWPPPPNKGDPPRPEKVSLPYLGCKGKNTQSIGEAKTGTLTCGLCQQNEFTEFLSFVSEKIRLLKEMECKSMILYSVNFVKSYESEWEIATQHNDDAVGSCVFSFVLRDEMKYAEPYRPDTVDFLFEHTTDKTALLIPVPRRVLPYRNMNRNIKLIQLYGHQVFTWVDRLIYTGSHLRRGVDSSTVHRYFQKTVELNRVCVAFAARPLRDDRGDVSNAFVQVGMNPEDEISQLQLLDKFNDGVIDAGLIAWDLRSDRCRKFNADLACTWGNDISHNLASDQFGYAYSFWQMGLIEAIEDMDHATTTSTSVWRDSKNNEPAVSIVDSRCHWYASATLECASAPETIELSLNASCPSGESCDDGLTKSGEGLLNFATRSDDDRFCPSSELAVSYPYVKCPDKYDDKRARPVIGKSATSGRLCGICEQNEFTQYLESISSQIKALKQFDCGGLLIYSVNFDRDRPLFGIASERSSSTRNTCTFVFSLAGHGNEDEEPVVPGSGKYLLRSKPDQTVYIIPVPRRILPYESMKRNALLLKTHGNQIFSWVERLIYVEPSLQLGASASAFENYFERHVESKGACSAYMSEPRPYRFEGSSSAWPNFWQKCQDAVLNTHQHALAELDSLTFQCALYLNQTEISHDDHDPDLTIRSSLDPALIDSGLMAFDLRSERCRNFNANFACSWGEEIHCNSDREDIGFPFVIGRMGLKAMRGTDGSPGTWIDPISEKPVVNLIQSQCHWSMSDTLKC